MIGVDVFADDAHIKLSTHADSLKLSFSAIESLIQIDRGNISRCLRGLSKPNPQIWLRYAIIHRVAARDIGLTMSSVQLPTESLCLEQQASLTADWSEIDEPENWPFIQSHVERLEAEGLSRDEIVKRFSVRSWSLVHNYRTGERRYSLVTGLRFAKALGVPVYQLGINLFSEGQAQERQDFLAKLPRSCKRK